MTNVLIVHGTRGHPKENWFGWLEQELERRGCRAFVPAFPTPENQTLENWMKVLEKQEMRLDENSIVVGHSLGVAFLLSVLEKTKAKAAFFVAGFAGPLGIPNLDETNKDMAEREFNWEKIRQNCAKFLLFNSDNDPYVPLEKGREIAKKLGAKMIAVKGAGHFNEAAGYTKFDLLLEKILEEVE